MSELLLNWYIHVHVQYNPVHTGTNSGMDNPNSSASLKFSE